MSEATNTQEASALKRLYKARVTMSQQAFGDLYQIGSQGMVWQYLNGKRPLNKDAAMKFARGLNCQIEDFSPRLADELAAMVVSYATNMRQQGIALESKEPTSSTNIKTAPLARKAVPVITLIRAGAMKEIDYVPEVWQGDRWESPQEKLGPRGWAHVVEGDSMDDGTDKGIPEGWLIFVDPDLAPRAGNFVIAKDVTTQSATFKKLTYDGGRWYLKPLNRQYQAIEIDSPELRVVGVVTEARPPSRKLL